MRASPLLLAVSLFAACSSGPAGTPTPVGGTASPGPTSGTPAPPFTPSPATASGGPSQPGAQLRVLQDGLTHPEFPFMVAAAFSAAQLESLLADLGPAGGLPEVDFEREAVLYLGISGSSSCPERFQQLFVDHAAARVHGLWAPQQPGQPCTDDLEGQGILLAVDRSALPDQTFLLSLREEPICADCIDHPDQQMVDPSR